MQKPLPLGGSQASNNSLVPVQETLDEPSGFDKIPRQMVDLVLRSCPVASNRHSLFQVLAERERTLKNATKWNNKLVAQNQALKQQLVLARENLYRRSRKGKLTGHFTGAGEYRLFKKRNVGHVSAESLLQIVDVPAHKGIVYKAERMGGAAFHAVARNWYEDAWKSDATWSIHIIRTDAFSSDIARDESLKAQVSEIISIFSTQRQARFVPDIQKVCEGTSNEFRALVLKQLQNLGTKTWLDQFNDGHVPIFVFVTDDGPDASGGCRIIEAEIRGLESVLFLRILCFMHQFHLACKKALRDLDWVSGAFPPGPRYVTQLMRICNVWRAGANHSKIKGGSFAPQPHASRRPPMPPTFPRQLPFQFSQWG